MEEWITNRRGAHRSKWPFEKLAGFRERHATWALTQPNLIGGDYNLLSLPERRPISRLHLLPVGSRMRLSPRTRAYLRSSLAGFCYRARPKDLLCSGACQRAGWRGPLEPLSNFMTNPAGSAIVNAVRPIRQIVHGE